MDPPGVTSLLFDLDPIDQVDELDLELSRCYKQYCNDTRDKSERELHNYLQEKASKSKQDYKEMVSALLYGLLTDSESALKHFQSISLVNRDQYTMVMNLLNPLVTSTKFTSMKQGIKDQLLWLCHELTNLNIPYMESIYLCLLRQIKGGDISTANTRFCDQTLRLLETHRAWLDSYPRLLSTAVYTYLRLIPEHRPMPLAPLQQREIRFVVSMIRQKWHICAGIGRDLIRGLQDVYHLPEFASLWADLLDRPHLVSPHCQGIDNVLKTPTPKDYLRTRLTPDMEQKLMFILQQLRIGQYHRNLGWFTQRFLSTTEAEPFYVDIVRFIVAGWYPNNQILQSDIVPRYVVIGTMLRAIKNPVVVANVKLALIYDWLFFTPNDNIMFIEPAMLLMERSAERYPYITCSLLEFILHSVNEYHKPMYNYMLAGVKCGMQVMLSKLVIRSLSAIYRFPSIDDYTKNIMQQLFADFLQDVLPPPQQAPSTTHPPQELDASAAASIDKNASQNQDNGGNISDNVVYTANPVIQVEDPQLTQSDSYDNNNGSSVFMPEAFDSNPHAQDLGFDMTASFGGFGMTAPSGVFRMTASSDDIAMTASSDDFVMTESFSDQSHDNGSLNESTAASETNDNENSTITTTEPATEPTLSDLPLIRQENSPEDSGSDYTSDENDGNADSSDTGMQSNQSYWIFGDALNRFKTSCATLLSSELDVEDEEFSVQLIIAKRSLKEILAVFLRMSIPAETLAPSIATPIRNLANRLLLANSHTRYRPEMTEDEMILDTTKDPLDLLLVVFWNNKEDAPTREKMIHLLGYLVHQCHTGKKRIVGMRWWHFIAGQLNTDNYMVCEDPDAWTTLVSTCYEEFAMQGFDPATDKEEKDDLGHYLWKDLNLLSKYNVASFCKVVPYVYRRFPEASTGNVNLLNVIARMLLPDQIGELVGLVFSKSVRIFGDYFDTKYLDSTFEKTDVYTASSIWQLLAAEVQVSTKLVDRLYQSDFIGSFQYHYRLDIMSPLLNILFKVPPSHDLVKSIARISNQQKHPPLHHASRLQFSLTVLNSWHCNFSNKLYSIIVEWFDFFLNEQGGSTDDMDEDDDLYSVSGQLIHLLNLWWKDDKESPNSLDLYLKDGPLMMKLSKAATKTKQEWPNEWIQEPTASKSKTSTGARKKTRKVLSFSDEESD